MTKEPIHIISLGAGVQSSVMLLLAFLGLILPLPVAAIFADTQDEPETVYRWLAWLCGVPVKYKMRAGRRVAYVEPGIYRGGIVGAVIPVVIATAGSLSEHVFKAIEDGKRVSNPPLFTLPDKPGEAEGLLTRDCTRDFKVSVIQRAARKIMREHKARRVIQWIGISLDETIRMKPSRVKYSCHRWPLIEMGMTRHACLLWMEKKGYPKPPRSACVYCPHHSNQEWRRIRDEEPESWARAVEFDAKSRTGIHKIKAQCFVHRSCVPLPQVDLSTDDERGQGLLWGNECEGMCGN